MKLRVEVVWQGRPWRKRIIIQRLAVVDAIFGVLVAVIYGVKLAFPTLEPEFPGFTSAEQLNNSLALVFLLVANLIQTLHASRLCWIVSQGEEVRDPKTCFEASKIWYDFSELSILFVTVKCIITTSYIFKVFPHPWVVTLVAVTLPEIIFKLYFLIKIYGFMIDLKECMKFMPKYRFIPVTDEESPSSSSPNLTNGFFRHFGTIDIIDINANTKLLV